MNNTGKTISSQAHDLNNRYPTWKALSWLFLFRLIIVAGLILAFSPAITKPLISIVHPRPIWILLLIHTLLILLSGLALYTRWPDRQQQVQLAVYIDIVIFTVIMHLAGGIASGFGLLLAISVTCGALLMEGRLSLLFASFATLGVITQQVYTQLHVQASSTHLTQAGLLGITFFTVAILAHVLYRRIRETEQIAASRQVDIEDLSNLNDHVIQSMETGVMALDVKRNIRLTNASANQLLALVPGKDRRALRDVAPPLDDWMEALAARPDRCPGTTTLQIGKNEVRVSCQLLGEPSSSTGTLIFLQDNQALAIEAQQIKLASLGRLTASIAHNIRNPLSAVSHAGQLLAESPDLNTEDRHLVKIIRRNADRLEETISSILQLSRRNAIETQTIDLVEWLAVFCEDFRNANRLSPSGLGIETKAAELPVSVDPRHLHQILANLCDNALVHAVVDGKLPHLEIAATLKGQDGQVIVDVMDDGPGIDPDTAREIFDPFFTTSASGTGLGLYIARELAETNGIQMHYVPRESCGCCFRLTFPL